LRKRVLRDGEMAALDPIVDLYNAVSLRYAVPVGGENLAAYVGAAAQDGGRQRTVRYR
jgi:DNA/RNA-binding domain of Phe-tRNA-synthetase-like protein